ncbi:bactofilin family protein [Sphingobacterium corticibacter]|uniref:Polymer-forming cytoskeletal protein n=1 Tax=Sphingobacterium corticibacter TaxID=2171749 RepID=A0A2T8HJQ8_9SPHI|nr:polymer-forming cytoskeletal protein [Sphingobacterium corticibacter]PVH25552.1 polymer-forming cytoskeletal protein [Sphingobacterium corticibacter]
MFNAKQDKVRKLNRPEDFQISTVIAEGISIEGALIGTESLRIDGKIKGNIRMGKGVIIGESAFVDGDISCETLIVYGHVKGDVQCQTLTLKSAGKLYGNAAIAQFSVDMGGQLIGTVTVADAREPMLLASKVD